MAIVPRSAPAKPKSLDQQIADMPPHHLIALHDHLSARARKKAKARKGQPKPKPVEASPAPQPAPKRKGKPPDHTGVRMKGTGVW
jgi:hypothetical protein